ncbi:long-chain fatty acid transport protein [Vibrio astriarenae]|nr:long-chain fatty acid transport protein [Vibrio sp. C7]
MPYIKRLAVVSFCFASTVSHATGLNFWESSTTNSALASANGARAMDASILATAPSSMTQLNSTTVTANVTRYQVDTDYHILGVDSDYSKSDPIPAGFIVTPLTPDWSVGLAMYSRTAADISVPAIYFGKLKLSDEVRLRPIVVSFAPSIAYQIGNLSIAGTLEYQYAEHTFERTECKIFQGCTLNEYNDATSGWGGAISATWLVNEQVSLAATHRFASQSGDESTDFDLPSITNAYASIELIPNLIWHNTYSLSRWKGKSIKFQEYPDYIGLLKGSQHSKRYATALEYQWHEFTFMGGVSVDEAIDSFGGKDFRYRLGMGYQVTDHLRLDIAGFSETYAKKYLHESLGSMDLNVEVQNTGYGVSLGMTYQF